MGERTARSRRHYDKNKDAILEKRKARRDIGRETELRALRKERACVVVRAAKDVPCADCSQRYPYYVMDFDHVRGEKVKNIARLVSNDCSMNRLAEEIDKCEVVCANCHRERTFQRQAAL